MTTAYNSKFHASFTDVEVWKLHCLFTVEFVRFTYLGLVRIKLWAIHMNRKLLGLCLVAVVIFDEVTTLHRLYDNFW